MSDQTQMLSKVKSEDEPVESKRIQVEEVDIIEKATQKTRDGSESEEEFESKGILDQKIVTVKDMVRVARSDIITQSRRSLLQNTVIDCASTVLKNKRYRVQLTNASSKTITAKVKEIFKTPEYRKDLTDLISRSLIYSQGLSNFVVIVGNDYDCHVKYSKKSLMQILLSETW